jgi:hypothetical protein
MCVLHQVPRTDPADPKSVAAQIGSRREAAGLSAERDLIPKTSATAAGKMARDQIPPAER